MNEDAMRSDKAKGVGAAHAAEKSDGKLVVCGRCEGTGNEFFSMYKRCTKCEGRGLHPAPGQTGAPL